MRIPIPRHPIAATTCVLLLWWLSAAAPANATLLVDAAVLPLGPTSFQWQITIENPGPDDVVLVSLFGAPLADPALGPSLTTPTGYLGSYDPSLGIVDFFEDTQLFAVGTVVPGFAFVTSAAPGSGAFATFQSLSLLGDFESGNVSILVIPEPRSAALVGLGIAALLALGRRKEDQR